MASYHLANRAKDFEGLPACFNVWCDYPITLDSKFEPLTKCNWKGKDCSGMYSYIVGENAAIMEREFVSNAKCPKCNHRFKRGIKSEDFIARLQWVAEHLSGFGNCGDVFPCYCNPQPPCDLVGEVRLKRTLCGDTVFCSDEEWLRTTAEIKCRGCGAKGQLALVERHYAGHVWQKGELIEKIPHNYEGLVISKQEVKPEDVKPDFVVSNEIEMLKEEFKKHYTSAPWAFIECDKTIEPISDETYTYINERWRESIKSGDPTLLILPAGMKVKLPLPGKYAFAEKFGGLEKIYTFQTLAEMEAFVKKLNET